MDRRTLALLLMSTALPAALPANAQQPVRVQVGDHAEHTRLVLVSPDAAPVVDAGPCGGRFTLPGPASWPVDQLNATYTRRLSGYAAADDGRSLTVQWPCGASVSTRRERALTIVDVAPPPVPARKPGAPPAPAAELVAAAPPPPESPESPPAAIQNGLATVLNPVATARAQTVPAPAKPTPPPAPDPMERAVRDSVEQTVRRLDPPPAPPPPAPPPAAPAPAPAATEPEPPPIRPFDLAAWADTDFLGTQRALEKAIADSQGRARVDALIAMARFALARALPEEGRAALESAEAQRPAPDQRHELRILADALRALDGTADPETSVFVRTRPGPVPDHHVWRSATLAPTRWADARDGLPIALKRLLSYPPDLRARLLTRLAEAASVGDPASLGMIVLEMITLDGTGSADGRLDHFRGRLSELKNEPAAALEHYRRAATAPGPYGHRAQVRAIELRRTQGALDDTGAVAELEALRYAWRGDDVETDALAALGAAYTRLGRTEAALDVFGLLGRRFGATARGRAALAAGRGLLTAVLDRLEQPGSGPLDAAALHVRHGRLIAQSDDEAGTGQRRLARLLARDGFTVEAARILHALAGDARGPVRAAARADIGTELARVLLDAGRGGEALEVLDGTGAPDLDAALAERRALLRAEAFAAEGEAVRAIDALRGLTGAPAARIRAQSLFRAGEWQAARAAYAELVEQPGVTADDVAHFAIAAFRAGDLAAVNAAAVRHRARLAGTRWAGLLDALATPPDDGKPLSGESVSRQLAAADALAGVMRRWRTLPQP
ncbi:MAG TPA: hypothetical protein VD995_19225 [Azospirillum sp.]|nr:hypothetical protein [Azospirillum sp.]